MTKLNQIVTANRMPKVEFVRIIQENIPNGNEFKSQYSVSEVLDGIFCVENPDGSILVCYNNNHLKRMVSAYSTGNSPIIMNGLVEDYKAVVMMAKKCLDGVLKTGRSIKFGNYYFRRTKEYKFLDQISKIHI
jgi:hypothetical protein